MSNIPITSAKNIQINAIEGYCKNKCSMRYDYKTIEQLCVSKTSSNVNINLKYEENTAPAISFDEIGYNPTNVTIYSPSLHKYNNIKANAEICITHSQQNSSPGNLYIFIPLMISSKLPRSSGGEKNCNETLRSILNNMSEVACSDETWIKMDFTINSFLPNKPYFFYKEGNNSIVVFHTNEYNVISRYDYNKLRRQNINLRNSNEPLFYSNEQSGQKITNDLYIEVKEMQDGSPIGKEASLTKEEKHTHEHTHEGFSILSDEDFCVKSSIENSISLLLIMSIFYVGFKVVTTKD